uniref:FUZ/MON1/HPS1 first Longin domain-containing protein n=1 Tax=Oryctolagus cuniculus TaxID=9986 RepID=G1U5U1_RABIT
MGEEGTGGALHLLCLAANSGVPLFCRSSRGGAPARQQLPFSVIGSLNGVHMFGQNLEVQLSSARTEDTTVVWRSFHDSITLIALCSEDGASELRLERLLHVVFGAMVLLVGLEELTSVRNVERLKKELRASYCLIDSFLGHSELIGDLTQCVDCVVPPEGALLQVRRGSGSSRWVWPGPLPPGPRPHLLLPLALTWPQKSLFTPRACPAGRLSPRPHRSPAARFPSHLARPHCGSGQVGRPLSLSPRRAPRVPGAPCPRVPTPSPRKPCPASPRPRARPSPVC